MSCVAKRTERLIVPVAAWVVCALVLAGCAKDVGTTAPDAATVQPDAAPAVDAAPPEPFCGDGVIDPGEVCDGPALDGQTCGDQGLPAGTLACTAECTLDTKGCAVCDDGICSDGETAVSCPADCGVVDVSVGASHSCAVLADGSLWCWGARHGHRMGGTGDVLEPVMLPGINTAVEVVSGRSHTCVRLADGDIQCWGANGFLQAGGTARTHEVFPPVSIGAGERIFAGDYHTCVRRDAATTECFGMLWSGGRAFDNAMPIQGGNNFTLGAHHTCLVDADGHVSCMGRNGAGQLGFNDLVWRPVPTSLASMGVILSLGTGSEHTCAARNFLIPLGTSCWGRNDYGQLGLVPGPNELEPVTISQLEFLDIDGGERHTCGKESRLEAPLYCWGHNARGQLGNGTTAPSYEPALVEVDEVVSFDSGAGHVCAVLPDATARCWGDNRLGQLGIGSTVAAVPRPIAPTRLGPAPEVAP